MKVTYKVTSMI